MEAIKLKAVIQVILHLIGVLTERGNLDIDTDTHRGRTVWGNTGGKMVKGLEQYIHSQKPRMAGKHQNLEEVKESPLELLKKAQPC